MSYYKAILCEKITQKYINGKPEGKAEHRAGQWSETALSLRSLKDAMHKTFGLNAELTETCAGIYEESRLEDVYGGPIDEAAENAEVYAADYVFRISEITETPLNFQK